MGTGTGGRGALNRERLKWSRLHTALLPARQGSFSASRDAVSEDLTNKTSKGASRVQAGDYRSTGTAMTPKNTRRGPGGDKTRCLTPTQRALG